MNRLSNFHVRLFKWEWFGNWLMRLYNGNGKSQQAIPRKPAESFGIYHKYDVRRTGTDEAVPDAFVLRLEKDRHARVAAAAYARSVQKEDPELADGLNLWLLRIYHDLPDDPALGGQPFNPDELPDGDYEVGAYTWIVQNGEVAGRRVGDQAILSPPYGKSVIVQQQTGGQGNIQSIK